MSNSINDAYLEALKEKHYEWLVMAGWKEGEDSTENEAIKRAYKEFHNNGG